MTRNSTFDSHLECREDTREDTHVSYPNATDFSPHPHISFHSAHRRCSSAEVERHASFRCDAHPDEWQHAVDFRHSGAMLAEWKSGVEEVELKTVIRDR